MCIEIVNNNMNANLENSKTNNKKISYTMKKLLKQIFKQTNTNRKVKVSIAANRDVECELKSQHSTSLESLESLESLDNQRNASIESECASLESCENEANERLLSDSTQSIELEDCDIADLSHADVPVRFVRSAHGTFFWTASADWPADNDLIEPLYCCTANQIAIPQDRWAQA